VNLIDVDLPIDVGLSVVDYLVLVVSAKSAIDSYV